MGNLKQLSRNQGVGAGLPANRASAPRTIRGQARSYGTLILLCLMLAACSDSDPEAQPSQTLRLDAGCDVYSVCIGRSDALSVSVRMALHRPALKPFSIELSSDAEMEVVTINLKMRDMDMGQNRYRLLHTGKGIWLAEVTLPVCTSGRSDWIAVIDLQTSNKPYRLSVPFTLEY